MSIMESKLNILRTACILACIFVLAACRSTVPEPTMPLNHASKPLPHYVMHNIGPQRVYESRMLKFADLDQDGNIDLLIAGRKEQQGFRVEWGDGAGHWSLDDGPETGMLPRDIDVADVNGDGLLEVLIAGEGDQKGMQVWALDRKNKWYLMSSPIKSGLFHAARFADVNSDGWPDIVAARYDDEVDGGVFVFLNDGRGDWLFGTGPLLEGVVTGLSVADVNHDGHADILLSRRMSLGAVAETMHDYWRQTGGVQIWYGDGNARWEPEVLFAKGDGESVTVSDVNGDGYLDVVAGLYQEGITLWLSDKGKGWKSPQKVTDKGTWPSVRVGDLEGDGSRELVAASSIGDGIGVWSWRQHRFVARTGLIPDYGMYSSVDVGDVRNLNRLDVAAVRMDGSVEVWSGLRAAPEVPQEFVEEKLGAQQSVYFDTAEAALTPVEKQSLADWFDSVGGKPEQLRFEIEGRADVRPIHSEIYPNNAALSLARAESVAVWLEDQGIQQESIQIKALGADDPLPEGMTPEALQQNRRVFVQAFKVGSVRLPDQVNKRGQRDLFHIDANHVFKTIDGIPDYIVGPGDELQLTFWQGGKNLENTVTVQSNGTVSLPYQEALAVDGLTVKEIDNKITKIISAYEKKPRVDVLVLKYRSKKASIFGEVQDLTRQPTGPGTYDLIGKEPLTDFLSRVGGPTKDADLTRVQFNRGGKTIILNLEKALKQGDWSENALIDEGDTIFIPSMAQSKHLVYVIGEVGKPGIVEYVGEIEFLDAVQQSGGLTRDAYMQDIRIIRQNRDAPLIMPVNFERFMEKGDLTQNLALKDKDVIIIPSRPIANWNRYLADITPSLNMLYQPLNAYTQVLSLQSLSRSLKK